MARGHSAGTRNGRRAPHRRQLAWWYRRATIVQQERSEASLLRREWDERWPW